MTNPFQRKGKEVNTYLAIQLRYSNKSNCQRKRSYQISYDVRRPTICPMRNIYQQLIQKWIIHNNSMKILHFFEIILKLNIHNMYSDFKTIDISCGIVFVILLISKDSEFAYTISL